MPKTKEFTGHVDQEISEIGHLAYFSLFLCMPSCMHSCMHLCMKITVWPHLCNVRDVDALIYIAQK